MTELQTKKNRLKAEPLLRRRPSQKAHAIQKQRSQQACREHGAEHSNAGGTARGAAPVTMYVRGDNVDDVFHQLVNDSVQSRAVLIFVPPLVSALASYRIFVVRAHSARAPCLFPRAARSTSAHASASTPAGFAVHGPPQSMLKSRFVSHQLVPLFNYEDLVIANERYVAGQDEVRLAGTGQSPHLKLERAADRGGSVDVLVPVVFLRPDVRSPW